VELVLEHIHKNGWQLSQESWQCLTPYGQKFASQELGRSKEYYGARLQQLGFERLDQVLDAGCGLGQWSIALAELNKHVVGVDVDTSRLLLARELAAPHNFSNLEFRNGLLETIPLPSSTCDAIFCYGVFTFVDMRRTIVEFGRVLRPGGKLYLNANAFGYWLHLLFDEGLRSYNYRALKGVLRSFIKTICGGVSQRIVTCHWLRDLVEEAGFDIRGLGPEGSLSADPLNATRVPSLYPESYYGRTAIWEVLAVKRG
jgi:ubiquinone/menaquinone biosynthesis C-methylase UbiE